MRPTIAARASVRYRTPQVLQGPCQLRRFSTGAAARLLAAEEQLSGLPDAAEAASAYAAGDVRKALGIQQRVADIFAAVPDPTLQLVVTRQLALM
jgi:hypothetical protein